MKYITKIDEDHKGFKAVILTSAGIGKQYTENKHKKDKNKYKGDKTDETIDTISIKFVCFMNGYR